MRYEYAYKTPDGVRHVEEMDAPSREAVFESLRAKGIKAIKVVAQDGSRSNGEVRVIGVKKRLAFAAALLALLAGASLMWFAGEDVQQTMEIVVTNTVPVAVAVPVTSGKQHIATPLPRQVILGDRKRIENAPTNLFSTATEYYLSKFAEPGRDFGGIVPTSLSTNSVELMQVLMAPIHYAEDEFTEYIDLKRITAGIKREMRTYLRGGHTPAEYLAELVKRQNLERDYHAKAEKKLSQLLQENPQDKRAAYDFWLKANAQLHAMGIYQLPLPDALRDYQMPFDLD